MLKISPRVLAALIGAALVVGAVTALLAVGVWVEGYWFLSGLVTAGLPTLVVWTVHGYFTDYPLRRPENEITERSYYEKNV